VDQRRLALDPAVARRPEEVRLQLDRREAVRALWQRRQAAVAGRCVRERDDRPRMEELVRGEELPPDIER